MFVVPSRDNMPITLHRAKYSPNLRSRGAVGALLLLAGSLLATGASAAIVYWDQNGSITGAGTTPTGTWDTTNSNKVWNSNSGGTTNPAKWTSGNDAVFSAGSDATGSYTVTVSGTMNASSITIEDGTPTFTSGTVDFNDATPDLIINSSRTLIFNSALISTSTGGLNLSGGGTLSLGSTTSLSGTLNLGVSGTAGTTLSLNGISLTLGTLNVTANSTIDFTGTSSLNLTTLTIASGVTLTITNWQNAADTFVTANWAGVTQNTINGSITNQVSFTGFPATSTGWESGTNQVRPMPEPATYGALLLGLTGGLLGWRRWRKQRAA